MTREAWRRQVQRILDEGARELFRDEDDAQREPVKELLTIPELARLSKESRRTIQRRIAAGEIEVVRLSPRSVRITQEEAERYLLQQPKVGLA